MKVFLTENKKSLLIFLFLFIFLLIYDLFLIPHINDISYIKNVNDIYKLSVLHPLLPISRLVNNLYPIQYFSKVGFREIVVTFTYVVNSFSIFEIIFLILILVNFYYFLFERNSINTLTTLMISSQFVVFLIHFSYSLIKIFNSFVFINYPVSVAMVSIRTVTIIALFLHLLILCLTLYILCKYLLTLNSKKNG